jgi:hypothetical protein
MQTLANAFTTVSVRNRSLQSEARRIWAEFDDGVSDEEDDPPPYVEMEAAKRRLSEGGRHIRMGDWDDVVAEVHKLRVRGPYWWVPYFHHPVRLRICLLVTTANASNVSAEILLYVSATCVSDVVVG